MSATIKLRRGTSLEWTNSNPNVVLSLGEPGFETDTHKLKIGDGTTAWNSLDYVSGGFGGAGGPLDYTYAVSYSANTFIANYDANDVINNLQINPTSHDIDFSAYYDDLIDNSYAINITLTQVEDTDKTILFSCNNIVDLTSTPPYPYYSFDVIELSKSASFTGFENTKKYYLNIDIKGQNFPELTEDRIDSLIVATGGISKNYDDAANPATLTLSIDPTFLNTSLVAGSGINLNYAEDELTVSASGLNSSYISDFSSSVSGLIPAVDVVQGSGVSVTSSSGTFTVGISGLNSSYISDFSSAVSTATQTALNSKAPLASPTFTGTVGGITSNMVGLGNVDNTSDANKPISTAQQTALDGKASSNHNHVIGDVTGLQTALDSKQASGNYATLTDGKVPSSQLPSYVDDVIEVANLAALPVSGETSKIYITLDSNKVYRWSGSTYVEISPSPGSTDSITEGSVNLYYTNSRASAAAPVQSVSGKTGTVTLAKSDVGLGNVDNTSDANKPISSTTQTALDGKASSVHTHTSSDITDFSSSVSGLFPVQIAPVDLHNGGVQTAQVLQFDDDSIQSVITGPTPPSGDSSQRIIIQGQRAQGGGEGGDVYVWGGDSDANGGDIKIYAGDADNVSPDSGYGGYVNIDGGKGANTGGNIEITAGYSAGGQAGDVEIVGGSTSSGVAGDVKIKTNNNTWTFSPEGNTSFPSGSIISETNNTLSLMPPTAASGQSLVVRPTAAIWAISSSNYIEYGNPITIVVTLGSWAYFGTVNYTISGTGVTPQSLGRALTGKLTFVSTSGPDAESITWTIPANSNITEFTLTLTSVDGTRSIDQEVDNDPILYYDFEESNGMPIGQFITVTNNGISSSEHSHVHLVAGNPSTVDIYLGDDDQYIKIEKNAGDVVIGTNSDTNHWTFGTDGGMTFPDGSIQTTAYPGNLNISTCLLHEYADPSGVSTPTSVVIDGMSYGGGQVVVDSAFGLGSSRITLYSNSMFAMVAVDADIDTVYYNGESGSDSAGDKSVSVGVSNYRGYYSYHNLISGSDPAIQQIVISKSSTMSGSNRSIDTNNDDFTVTGLSGSDVVIVLNLYWSNTNGPDYSTSTTVAIQQFIDLVMFDDTTPRTNINDIRTAFYDNSATIKTVIENEENDLLYSGFEFYRSFQKVTPSGGSGSGAVLEIEVFDRGDYDDEDVLVPGTGYQINDTLTVTGDLLGGTTPANDVTITVLSVNPGGGIIGYSTVGTSISTLWPDSYIIDGDDDQYDIGNFIGTNRTRSTAMVTLAYDPIEEDGNGGDDVFQILTILSADKTISEGQWVWFEEQNNGAFINHTLSTGGLNSSDIGDFSSAVSELLPVKNVVQGSGVSVTSSGGTFTVGVSGLNSSYISDFNSSVNDRVGDLLVAGDNISLEYINSPASLTVSIVPTFLNTSLVSGSGISLSYANSELTVRVSGLNSSYISDFSSAVSTATQTALNSKAPLASPTFTGTVNGITKSMVGLGNVDNTSDANKPISTAQQTALDGKASSSHNHAISDVTGLQTALDNTGSSPDAGFINKLQLATTSPTVVSTTLNYTGPNAVGFQSKYLNFTSPPTSGLNGKWKYDRLPGVYNLFTGVTISGVGGQFSCNALNGGFLRVGQQLTISGTLAGTGTITGYANPTTYLIGATNGATTFTLTTVTGAAIVTTTGTPTGLTYTLRDYLATNVAVTDTSGGLSCAITALRVGQTLRVAGTSSGTGSIAAGDYFISETNGSTTFRVINQNTGFTPVTTVAGTTTGLTFSILERMNFSSFNPYYPTVITGEVIADYADAPKIKKKNLKTLWAVITPHHTMTMTAGSLLGYLYFNVYTFDNTTGSPLTYTNRFDYLCTKAVENFSNEVIVNLQGGHKYLIYAKDSGKYLPNVADTTTPTYAGSTFPSQLTTEMLKDPYDMYTDIPHIPFVYNLVKAPTINVIRITGTDGTFNCNPLYIAGGTTSYLANGQLVMILGAFANGIIVSPPFTAGNLYIIDGTPTIESNGTVTFKLKTLVGDPLVTTLTTTTLSSVVLTGTAGQFSCASSFLKVGQTVTISGTLGGTGSITGYSNPTTYVIGATNTTTTGTLFTTAGAAIATTAGTPTGLTYTSGHAGTTLAFYVNPPDPNNTYVSQMALSTSTSNPGIPLGITVDSMGYSGTADDSSEVNVKLDLVY